MSAQAGQDLSGAHPPSPAAGRRRAQLIESGARAATAQALSLADVHALKDDPSPASRAALAAKFGRQYDHLAEGDTRPLAEAVLELLVRELEKSVRQALAEAVAASASLPHGVATRLARDEFDVARPLLERSPVLSDEDLAEIVRTHAMQYALAVAGREHLSEWLSDVLADTNEPEVVATLTGNPGAKLSVATLRRIAEDYRGDRAVQDRLIRRPALPYELVDQLVSAIGERLEWELIQQRRISKPEARQLMAAARDRATLSIVAREHGEKSIERELRHRFTTGELGPEDIVAFLRDGEIARVEAGLALLADVDVPRTRQLLYGMDKRGLAALRARGLRRAALSRPAHGTRSGGAGYGGRRPGHHLLGGDDHLRPAAIRSDQERSGADRALVRQLSRSETARGTANPMPLGRSNVWLFPPCL